MNFKKTLSLILVISTLVCTFHFTNVNVLAASTKSYTKKVSSKTYKNIKIPEKELIISNANNDDTRTIVITNEGYSDGYINSSSSYYLYNFKTKNPQKYNKVNLKNKIKKVLDLKNVSEMSANAISYNDIFYISGYVCNGEWKNGNVSAYVISTKNGKDFEKCLFEKANTSEYFNEGSMFLDKYKDTYFISTTPWVTTNGKYVLFTTTNFKDWNKKTINIKELIKSADSDLSNFIKLLYCKIITVSKNGVVFNVHGESNATSSNLYFYTKDFKTYKIANYYKKYTESNWYLGAYNLGDNTTLFSFEKKYNSFKWYTANSPSKKPKLLLNYKNGWENYIYIQCPLSNKSSLLLQPNDSENALLFNASKDGKTIKEFNTSIDINQINDFKCVYDDKNETYSLYISIYKNKYLLVSKSCYEKYSSIKLKIAANDFVILGDSLLLLSPNGSQTIKIKDLSKIAK